MNGRWRVGRKVGRTLYIHPDGDPDGDGVFIGALDSRELAEFVVRAVEFFQANTQPYDGDEMGQ